MRRAAKDTASFRRFLLALLLAVTCSVTTPFVAMASEVDSGDDAEQSMLAQVDAPEVQQEAQQDGLQDNQQDSAPEVDEQLPSNTLEPQGESFTYQHDPRDNPSAMKDIVVNEDAVYGFSPSPTGSLKDYVDYDWTDPELVEAGRQQRIAYHEGFSELYDMIDQMTADGASTEEIARAVSTRRNEMRLEAYKDDPEGLAVAKARNLEQYGNENGGTPEFFYDKYGSWEKVIEKSLSVNSGMDACTGLYDDYYDMYVAAGQVPADPEEPTEPEEPNEEEAEEGQAGEKDSPANDSQSSEASSSADKLPATGDATCPVLFLVILAGACLGLGTSLREGY